MFYGILILLVLGMAFLTAYWMTWQGDAFSPPAIYLYWMSTTFLVRPAFIVFGWDQPHPPSMFPAVPYQEIGMAAAFCAMWLFSYVVGFHALPQVSRNIGKALPRFGDNPDRQAYMIVLAALTSISIAGALYGMAVAGFNFSAAQRAVRMEKLFEGLSFIEKMPGLVAFFCVGGLLMELKARRRGEGSRFFLGVMIVLLLANFTANWTYADRSGIFWPLVALAIGLSTIYRIGLVPIAGSIAAFASLAMLLRRFRFGGEAESAQASGNLAYAITRGLNLNNFDTFMRVVRDWGDRQLRYGEDFWNGIIGVIPRIFWADKPEVINSGVYFARYYNPDKVAGTPITIIGEWYSNFHIPGIIVGGILAGIIYRGVTERYRDYRTNSLSYVAMIYVILNVTAFGVSNGFFRQIILGGAPLLALVVATHLLGRFRAAADQPSRPYFSRRL